MLYVRCYQWDPDWLKGRKLSEEEQKKLAFRGADYDGIPKEGERVTESSMVKATFMRPSVARPLGGTRVRVWVGT